MRKQRASARSDKPPRPASFGPTARFRGYGGLLPEGYGAGTDMLPYGGR